MSVETGQKIVEKLFQTAERYRFSQVELKYSGGEPLLRFPALLAIHRTARQIAQAAQINLDAVVLTNGTRLSSTIIHSMLEHNLRLMISMDCLEIAVNQARLYGDGRPSTDDVKKAVELALRSGLVPNISITVSARNTPDLPAFVEWLLVHDLPFNLNFYRENTLSADEVGLRLHEETIIASLLETFAIIQANLPRRKLFSTLIDRSDLASPHRYPCGVGKNYLVFNPLGEISKCHMTQDERITHLQAEDPLRSIREDNRGLQNPLVEEKPGCQDCEWRYACAGGCPLLTHRQTGSYYQPSPNCNIYRAVYPEALRLEGLRLLKYGSDSAGA
jgi:uncharacterized protein